MSRIYSIGFGLMSVVMIVLGVTLFIVTLIDPGSGGSIPEYVWLVGALARVVLGAIAGALAIVAWRQTRRPQV